MKKVKEHTKKPVHVAPEAVHGTEPGKTNIGPASVPKELEIKAPASVEIADKDQFRHHATEESRIFRKGDVIPAGWTKHPVAKIS